MTSSGSIEKRSIGSVLSGATGPLIGLIVLCLSAALGMPIAFAMIVSAVGILLFTAALVLMRTSMPDQLSAGTATGGSWMASWDSFS